VKDPTVRRDAQTVPEAATVIGDQQSGATAGAKDQQISNPALRDRETT
jgi:hypothetical protein